MTDLEKAYAKRVYKSIFGEDITPGQPDISDDVFLTELYAKWGLGPKRKFRDEEKVYIAGIEETAESEVI